MLSDLTQLGLNKEEKQIRIKLNVMLVVWQSCVEKIKFDSDLLH